MDASDCVQGTCDTWSDRTSCLYLLFSCANAGERRREVEKVQDKFTQYVITWRDLSRYHLSLPLWSRLFFNAVTSTNDIFIRRIELYFLQLHTSSLSRVVYNDNLCDYFTLSTPLSTAIVPRLTDLLNATFLPSSLRPIINRHFYQTPPS